MKLMWLMKLIPLRDETGSVYKWQEEQNLVSPMQVLRAKHEPTVDHVVVHMKNGEQMIVESTLEELNRKFMEATT